MTMNIANRNIVYLLIACVACVVMSCKSNPPAEAPPGSARQSGDYVAEADTFYAKREDLMQVRQGIVALRQARTADYYNYDAAWRLAKFNYYLAIHATNDAERDAAFREGIEAGKDAVKLQDGKPDGHFWLGANYGGSAQTGTLSGLATVDDIRNEMATVIRLDEGYQNGSAYMVLGLVYLQAPKLLGGDPQKAIDEMEKGLRFGQTNAFLHLHLAEAYLKVGRKADAKIQLDTIISMTPDQNYLPEYNEASSQARQLLPQTG